MTDPRRDVAESERLRFINMEVWTKNGQHYLCHAVDGDDCIGPFPSSEAAYTALNALRSEPPEGWEPDGNDGNAVSDRWMARALALENENRDLARRLKLVLDATIEAGTPSDGPTGRKTWSDVMEASSEPSEGRDLTPEEAEAYRGIRGRLFRKVERPKPDAYMDAIDATPLSPGEVRVVTLESERTPEAVGVYFGTPSDSPTTWKTEIDRVRARCEAYRQAYLAERRDVQRKIDVAVEDALDGASDSPTGDADCPACRAGMGSHIDLAEATREHLEHASDSPEREGPDPGCSECNDWFAPGMGDHAVTAESPECPIRGERCVRYPAPEPAETIEDLTCPECGAIYGKAFEADDCCGPTESEGRPIPATEISGEDFDRWASGSKRRARWERTTRTVMAVEDAIDEWFERHAHGASDMVDHYTRSLLAGAIIREVRGAAPSPEGVEDRFAAAVAFAATAHAGQVYKGYGGRPDEPYILHPLRVAMAVGEKARVVAVLHDVFEDTDAEAPGWLTQQEIHALDALTRKKGEETYDEYIGRLTSPTAGATAREVKRADLLDNLRHDPPDRLRDRYEDALARLGNVLASRTTEPERGAA